MNFRVFLLLLLIGVFSVNVAASPWIEADNARLRSHVELLVNGSVLDLSVTSWPLMWSDLAKELARVEVSTLNASQYQAYAELKFELRYQKSHEVKRDISVSVSNSEGLFEGRSDGHPEQYALSKSYEWDGDSVSLKLQGNLSSRSGADDFFSSLDGSHLLTTTGEWVWGLGSVERWWGAGNASSLILSHNTRPLNGFVLRTQGDQSFSSKWLSWLGAWQFISFVSQLEGDRVIPEAKLTGMRFTFRPFDGLEVGMSRAMMWGGEGRDNSLSAFWKSLTASDENTYDGTGGTGNQLGGFDVRYGGVLTDDVVGALYFQLTGEDEAGALPSKYLSLFGVEFSVALPYSSYFKSYIEYSDTTAGSLNEPEFGVAYNHSAYQTGYRYRGRALGSSFDGDAQAISIGGSWVLPDQRMFGFDIRRVKLNRAGQSRANSVSAIEQDLTALNVRYEFLFSNVLVKVTYGYIDRPDDLLLDDTESHRFLASFEYRY